MRKLAMIAAMTDDMVIGKSGKIPWRIPEDFKHFKATTMGRPIIMGRKTWESIGSKPLPGRTNIVLSRTLDIGTPGCCVCPTLDLALTDAYSVHDEPFVIGGAQIYEAFADLATRLVFTRVMGEFDGDTYFPVMVLNDWKKTRHDVFGEGLIPYEIVEWVR